MDPSQSTSIVVTDHDLLIRLDTKVDNLTTNVNTLSSSVIERLVKVESRLDANDVYHAAIPLPNLLDDAHWVEAVRSNWKIVASLYTLVVALLASIITKLTVKWFNF